MTKNNRFARAFYILVVSLPSSAKQQRELTKSERMTAKSSFYFLVPGQFSSIFHVKPIGMTAKELQKRKFKEVVFLNDVLVAVAALVS